MRNVLALIAAITTMAVSVSVLWTETGAEVGSNAGDGCPAGWRYRLSRIHLPPKYSVHSHPGINPNKIDEISSIAGYIERNAPDAKHPFLVSGSDLDKVKKQSTDVGENYLYTSRIQKHFIRY